MAELRRDDGMTELEARALRRIRIPQLVHAASVLGVWLFAAGMAIGNHCLVSVVWFFLVAATWTLITLSGRA